MVAITTADSHKFPWYVRLFFWNQRRRYGAVLAPSRLWGRTPMVFSTLALLYGALDRRSSPIAPASVGRRVCGWREHFSEDATTELAALIAFQNLSSKFNATLEVSPHGFRAVVPALMKVKVK